MGNIHPTTQKVFSYVVKNPEATVRQIMKHLRIRSTSVVQYHLLKLQAQGKIERIARWQRIDCCNVSAVKATGKAGA